MSTDHPHGASFLAYPEIIALLMDRTRREEVLKRLPPGVKKRCTLADLDREYSLYEIAIITRAAPARMLGLESKGHLGVGADADITIYNPDDDLQRMFEIPRYVLRAGEVIVEDGEIRKTVDGKLYHVAPDFDHDLIADIQSWFEKYYTIQFRNYPVDEQFIGENQVVATGSRASS